MVAGLAYRFRSMALAVALAALPSGPALSQQSGTVLRESLTLLGGTAATIKVDIAGPKTATSETNILLEFGPDGNSRTDPAPDPVLPATVTFSVAASIGGSRLFSPAGGVETQAFSDKIVALQPLDRTYAPGLYALSVLHQQAIPAGVTETWTLDINGLPPRGIRAIASVRQGVFKSLTPTGVSQGPPAIAIGPAPIARGAAAALVVKSSGGLDLSGINLSRVTITPGAGISNVAVSSAAASSAVLSFNVADCAPAGERTLTIQDQTASASTVFAIAGPQLVPAISIAPARVLRSTSPTLSVTSSGCFDLSAVSVSQITITPSDGISNIAWNVTSASTATLSFAVADDAPVGSRNLVLTGSGGSVMAGFTVAQKIIVVFPPCSPGQKCCEFRNGRCARCEPITSLCRFQIPVLPRFEPL